MFEITIALVAAILALAYTYLTWYFGHWRLMGVPGPKPRILVGNFKQTHNGKRNFVEELHDIYLNYKAKHRYVGVFLARKPQLFVMDPMLARQILKTNFSSFHDNEASMWTTQTRDPLRYASPIACTGTTWKERRLEIGPATSVNRLRSFYPVMTRAASKLCEFIRAHMDNLDVEEAARKYTSEIMADFIWGLSADSFREVKAIGIHEAAKSVIAQALKCVNYYGQTSAFPWLRKMRPERFFPKPDVKFFSQLTADAEKLRRENPSNRMDVLNFLLRLQEKHGLAEAQKVGYTTTVMIDGFETAAITVCHCILMLARNQNAQTKLRAEILESLTEEGTLSYERLTDLPYLDQCVFETLRLFPPVPTFFKLCTAAIDLENSDGSKVHLEKGDTVYISNYSFHHDADFFENPEEFIPERFDPECGGTRKYRDMGVLLPFGDGPRICIGVTLGLMEIKVAVAELIQKFHITTCPTTRTDNLAEPSSFLLCLKGGIRLKFQPLD